MDCLYKVVFWQGENGDKPVAKWLKSLTKKDQIYIGDLLRDLALDGPRSHSKIFKHLEGTLWEIRDLRSHSPGYRVYFSCENRAIVCLVVNAGDKKSQQRDIDVAKERLKKKGD